MMLTSATVLHEYGATTDYVLTAVDRTSRYLRIASRWIDFWTQVGAHTARPLTPLLVTVDGAHRQLDDSVMPFVLVLDTPHDLQPALVAQVCRLIVPAHLGCADSVVLTTDVDMLPLQPRYYDHIVDAARSHVVVARDVMGDQEQFAMCYLAARQHIWREIIGDDDIGATLAAMCARAEGYTGRRGGPGWHTDQQIAFDLLRSRPDLRRLSDADTGHARLDRTDLLARSLASLRGANVLRFADYHAHLPVTRWGWLHALIGRRLRRALASTTAQPLP